MSKYEWERGEIIIPKGEWVAFRKEIILAWNTRQERVLALAKKAHAAALAAAKGRRGAARQSIIKNTVASVCGGKINEWGEFVAWTREWGGFQTPDEARHEDHRGVFDLLFHYDFNKQEYVLRAPKRKDARILPLTKNAELHISDATIIIRNESRSVVWVVHENNHACEHARAHWFASKLFSRLGRVRWTRNTGGVIVGNDEYNRDADYVGGGGNYVTASFGPLGSR